MTRRGSQLNEFGETQTEPKWLPTPEQIRTQCAAILAERAAATPAPADNDDDDSDDEPREHKRRSKTHKYQYEYQARYRARKRLERLK